MRDRLASALRSLPLDAPARHRLRVLLHRLMKLVGRPVPLPGLEPQALRPLEPVPGAMDFVFFGVIDWHYRFQRPQQLAVALARRGHRVLYISSAFIDSPRSGFRVEPLDSVLPIYQVHMALRGAPAIYWESPTPAMARQLGYAFSQAMEWSGWSDPVLVLGHPFWFILRESMKHAVLIYDRMDLHEGFERLPERASSAERDLMRSADLTICSSRWLADDTARFTDRVLLLRNATDYAHFAAPPASCYRDSEGRRTIGYYGAIAAWLDLDLVAAIARTFSDCSVVLIGRDQIGAARALSGHPNIRVLNEAPYRELPRYLYGFDVCILPRLDTPLTRAMNPVKLYEYLSAGKPVVASDLPELNDLVELKTLVYTASDRSAFARAVASALAETPDDPRVERRREFAAAQTWSLRAEEMARHARALLSERAERAADIPQPRSLGAMPE